MAVKAATFLGRNFYRPGAYGAFTAAPQAPGQSLDTTTLIIIGPGDNGPNANDTALAEADRYMEFEDFKTAKAVIKGGTLLEAIRMAFSPSTDEDFAGGPQVIKAVNINPNTKASKALDTTKSANTSTLTAAVAGAGGNKIRVRKTLSTKIIEIGTEDGVQKSPTLEWPVFKLTYTGDATTAVLVINSTSIAVTLAGDQMDGSADLAATFANYPTLGELADYVNNLTGYSLETLTDRSFTTSKLDAVESGESMSVKTVKTLYADAEAEKLFLESTGLVAVTMATVRKPLADMSAFSYLASGATGSPGGSAYTSAIDFAEQLGGMHRALLSTSQADQIYFSESVTKLNSAEGQNETFGAVGASASDAIADRLTNARILNNRFMVYGLSTFVNPDLNGVNKTYGGVMLGVLHAAMKAGALPHLTTTWKALNIVRTDEILTKAQRRDAIQAGALAIARVVKGGAKPWVIERAVTTYQAENLVYNESSTVFAALVMVREMREMFAANFIGEVPVDPTATANGPTEADLKSAFELKMDEYVRRGMIRSSPLLGLPAWYRDDYKIRIDGDSFYFEDVQGNISAPINFIFTLLEFDVIRGTTA